tara:strand:+ start:554 stop:676 length:123 start_codon:yes stop_codon:yes gene_type:complete
MDMNDHFVIARSDSDEAIQGVACRSGLLRCARNDGNGEME